MLRSTLTGPLRMGVCAAGVLIGFSSCHTRSRSVVQLLRSPAPVIIISIDTLRSDRLPLYGSKSIEAAAFDRLGNDGIVFEHAYSHCPLTLPSHLTIFTGLLPHDTGVHDNIGFVFNATKHPTIASMLKRRGYSTGAAVSAYVLRGATGVSAGFDSYDDAIPVLPNVAQASLRRPGSETIAVAERWLEQHHDERFFYFLHLYEPHAPYDAPEPFRSRYPDPYDAEVAYSDFLLSGFVDFLKRHGLYDASMIIVLSDHGEGLMDHGEQEHGILLYREDLQVPLVLKLPHSAGKGQRVSGVVQLSDVFATVASVGGCTLPHDVRAKSLISTASAADAQRTVFSETLYPRIHLGWSDLRSLCSDRYQYIEAPLPELYDLRRDAAEKVNVRTSERRVANEYRTALNVYNKTVALPMKIDPEEAAKLAALGYISTTKPSIATRLPDPKDRIGDIEMVRAAFNLAAQKRYPEAIMGLRRVLQLNPSWSDAWTKLASCYEELGDNRSAADLYQQALRVSPSSAPEVALSLASVLVKLGRFDEAATHARLALPENPGGTHQILAEIALARRQLDDAEREARMTMQSAQFRLQGELLLAQVEAARGRLNQVLIVVDQLQKDAAVAHRLPFAYLDFVRGDVLARLNRNDEAIAAFRREIAAFPQERQPYANLALLQLLAGERTAAHATLAAMFDANPDRHTALFAARTLDTIGDRAEAAVWRRRAEPLR